MDIQDIQTAVAEYHSETKNALDKFQMDSKNRFSEVVKEQDKLGEHQREISDRLLMLEQSGGGTYTPADSQTKSIASQLSRSPEIQSFVERKVRNAGMSIDTKSMLPSLETKNTIVSTAATNPAQQLPGVVGGPEQRAWLRQLFPTMRATSSSFVYTRELAFTNNAAAQASEGAAKAESDVTFEEVTGTIATYAHWLKMSRQVMTDNMPLVDFTQRRATYGLELKIEDALLNADGTSGTMSGLLKTGNFTAFTPTAGDTQIDSLRKAKLALEAANYMCGLFILNPTDTAAIELLKDVDENYLVGKPIEGGLKSLWGVPVYSTSAITAGTFVALDNQQAASLHLREEALVEFSDSDGDNFTKNLITMRVEARLGFAVHLPAGVRSGSLTV